jgi:hypothetical protein
MPATWAEFQDVKEKARITHERAVYSYKVLRCEYDWLKPHIPVNGNLLELNLLALRVQNHIQDRLDVFEAMVDIETQRGGGQPIQLPRLINLTFNLDNCHVAGNIRNDAELGNFLYENGTTDEVLSPVKIMDRVKSVSVGYAHTMAAKTDGSLWVWGRNYHRQFGIGGGSISRALR